MKRNQRNLEFLRKLTSVILVFTLAFSSYNPVYANAAALTEEGLNETAGEIIETEAVTTTQIDIVSPTSVAQEKDTSLQENDAVLFTTELADETVDLTEYCRSVTLKDKDGNTVAIDGSEMVNTVDEYTITLAFAEKAGGIQFSKTMTCQLPSVLKVSGGISNRPLYAGANEIGTFSLSTDGILTVSLDETWINEHINCEFSADCDVYFQADDAQEDMTVNFGNNVTIKIDVKAGGNLDVDKPEPTYDEKTRTLLYTVKATSTGDTTDVTRR